MTARKAMSRLQGPADPSANPDYATKQYIDNLIANFPKGRVFTQKLTTTTNFTTTETVCESFSGTLTASRRYKVIWRGAISSNQAGGTGIVGFLRWKQTSTVDATGTAFDARDMGGITDAENVPQLLIGDFVPSSTANHVVAVTWKITGAGQGTIAYGAATNHRLFIVEDCGV